MTAVATPKPVRLDASKDFECWYEYSTGAKEVLATGHRVIMDADDPRWDGELTEKPFKGDPNGYLGVYEVTRVDGEVVKKRGICGYRYHMNKAREFMRSFQELKAKGSAQPWDQERYFRELTARAGEAKREGRAEELEMLREAFKMAVASATTGKDVS